MLTPVDSTVLPENKVNVLLLTVDGFSGLLKGSTAVAWSPIWVDPSFGVTDTTWGAVVSTAAPVVNAMEMPPIWFPARSCSGEMTSNWYWLLAASGTGGGKG